MLVTAYVGGGDGDGDDDDGDGDDDDDSSDVEDEDDSSLAQFSSAELIFTNYSRVKQ